MIMMPNRTTLSRVLASLAHLLSVAWNKVTFSSTKNESVQASAVYRSPSVSSLKEEIGPRSSGPRERVGDLPASLETLAEQMLGIVEIVSVQEKTIQSLKQRCQKLEDHNQAIMVAFTTFFHVLAAGRVAKIEEIAGILTNITDIAEREERPQDAIVFLRDLAAMLAEQSHETVAGAEAGRPKERD
jgi:hypothetical protein